MRYALALFCLLQWTHLAAGPIIVVGFVGGFVRHNDSIHQEVLLADRLRKDYSSGVEVSVFANHQGRQAHEAILRLLATAEERQAARVILYGHSWGASEAVTIARQLQKDSVPVLLTIQVDSVAKLGSNDRFIPANVSQAINFYQRNGFFHGQRRIVAVDPQRTRILGNIQSDYTTNRIQCDGYPWYAQLFMKPHIEIESDPGVWNQVDSLIRAKLDLHNNLQTP